MNTRNWHLNDFNIFDHDGPPLYLADSLQHQGLSFQARGLERSFDKKNMWSKTRFLVNIHTIWALSLKNLGAHNNI